MDSLTPELVKRILRYEYGIHIEPVQIFVNTKNRKQNKYVLLYEDGRRDFPDEVTMDMLQESLAAKGFTLDYE